MSRLFVAGTMSKQVGAGLLDVNSLDTHRID